MLEAFDAVPGLAGAGEVVAFVWEADHDGWDTAVFEGTEELFAAGIWGRPPVGFAEDEHHRRLDLGDVRDRRSLTKALDILERRSLEPRGLKLCKIGRVPPIRPVRYVTLRNGSGKSRGLRNGPIGQHAAARAARDAELFLIDVAAFDDLIDGEHEVFVVVAGIVVLDDIAEILPVTR